MQMLHHKQYFQLTLGRDDTLTINSQDYPPTLGYPIDTSLCTASWYASLSYSGDLYTDNNN